ncbi:hypothetical protein CCUG60884_00249 [Mycobacteroides salmoniphilum]|uniref:Uncharacterized protein n=1 Tax=Mycobacteroides salmoniphilum TaxID=404941 RepID=A0A4R8SZM6_9MYCO|nr:hypothetical protein CCUG60884_00249 [Mycobacteroides salmoniphilum]
MTDETPRELENDRTAMMLGLVPDKRSSEQRLLDAVLTNGESVNYRHGASAVSCCPLAGYRPGQRHMNRNPVRQ